MKIPLIRSEMHLLAEIWGGPFGARLHHLAEETKRRPYVRRAPVRRHGRPSRAAVLRYLRAHPDADNMEIGNALGGYNPGRISEALAGFKT